MDNTEEFRCLSLCSGYAGIELGLRRVIPTLRTVAYVEVEAFAAANLVAKTEAGLLDAAPIWTDIKTFPARYFRYRVHIITAGYPCQPFSVAGKRGGESDPRHLWPYIERIIEAVEPLYFFGENVPGHLTIGFSSVYRSLRNLGYSIEAGLFTAAECGASIAGERLFILATANHIWKLQQKGSKRNKRQWVDNGNKEALASPQSKGYATSQLCRIRTPRPRFTDSSSYIRGVAFQGEEQYEWEEPRALAKANNPRNRRGGAKAEQNSNKQKNRIPEQDGEHCNSETQSRLGRAIDGTSSRLDRIRLLGNGVVPQQAEKAFRELIEKLWM